MVHVCGEVLVIAQAGFEWGFIDFNGAENCEEYDEASSQYGLANTPTVPIRFQRKQ